MLNNVVLMGRITKDPELKTTPGGIPVCTFTIAVERSYVKQGQEKQTDFIEISVWRNTAEFVCRNFAKGNMIAVRGELQTRKFVDKNGNNRTAYEVLASDVFFCGSKQKTAQDGAEDFAVVADDEDIPF